MRAYCLIDMNHLEFQEVGEPAAAVDEVLLRVIACGVCGTDLHLKRSGHYAWRGEPLTLGHEIYAEIEEVGEEVPFPLQRGDRVVVDPQLVCRECRYCRLGRYNLCDRLEHLGISVPGGFQDYLVVPPQNVYRIDPAVPPHLAALTEPVATCVAAIKLAQLTPEDRVLVVGLGFFGQTFLQLARLWGVDLCIGCDPIEERRQLALQLGASMVLDPQEPKAEQKLREITQGLGASVVFDAAGSATAAADCIRFAGKMGRVIVFGYRNLPVVLPWYDLLVKELTVLGSKSSNHAWELSVRLMEQNKLNLEPLVQVYPFERAPEAFAAAEARQILKGVLLLKSD